MSGESTHRRFRLVVVAVSVIAAAIGSVLLAMRDSPARTTTQGVTATLSVPGHPEAVVAGPDALWVALSRDADVAEGEPRLLRLDLATKALAQPVYLGGNVAHLARVGERLVASVEHPSGFGQLVVLDWKSGVALERHWFDGPIGQIVSHDGDLWALEARPTRLLRLDPNTLQPLSAPLRLASGRTPALTTGDGYLWATAADAAEVLRIDPATREIKRVHVGGAPVGIALNAGSVWFADQAGGLVRRLDTRSLRPLGDPIQVGTKPSGLTAAAASLFVTDQDDGTVVRIDANSATRVGLPIRIAAHAVGGTAPSVSPAGKSVWVSNFASNTLERIDPASGRENGGGEVTVRISGTGKCQCGDRVTNGGVAGKGRFVASGAISKEGKIVVYRTVKPPLITLRYVASDSEGTVTYVVKIDMDTRPDEPHPWTITSATKAYKGLHGEGVEKESSDFSVSTLTGVVSR